MPRLLLAISMTVTAVAFALANTHRVPLSFVIGNVVHVRMIFLLLTAFICGVMTAVFYQLIADVKEKRRQRLPDNETKALAPVKEH